MKPNSFFIHMGKCGGMSIRSLLKELYPNHNYDIYQIFESWDRFNHHTPAAFFGHATYTLSSILPAPLYTFTVLRHPVDRVFSYWKHMVREGASVHTSNAHLLALDFKDAIQHPDFNRLHNGMTKALGLDLTSQYEQLYEDVFFDKKDFTTQHNLISAHLNNSGVGIDRCYCDESMLDVAKNTLDNIEFGLYEHFDSDVIRLLSPLGDIKHVPNENVMPSSQSSWILTEEERYLLEKYNSFDMELYNYATKRYQERYQM